jgi:hypothetical protein
LGIVLEK